MALRVCLARDYRGVASFAVMAQDLTRGSSPDEKRTRLGEKVWRRWPN